MKKKISNSLGKFPNNEKKYVLDVLNTNTKTDKNYVQKLETKFKKIFKTKYAIACNSGTSGLHASLASLNLKKNDEIIIPALTVVMDAYATIHLNATPIFADVDPDTFLITAETIKKKITKRTKAVMLVSLQGLPVDIKPIIRLAKKHKFIIIEDNAQDFYGKINNSISGTLGDIGIWSFENKKHLSGATEGGIITTNNVDLAEKMRKFAGIGYKNMTASGGRTSLSIEMVQDPNYERFDTIGLNYRMPQIVAAVCLGQLENFKNIIKRRQQVAKYFREAIKNCNWIVEQKTPKNASHTHYTFAVKYFGDLEKGISWKKFYKMYKSKGGDGFYGACVCPHQEPSLRDYFAKIKYKPKIHATVAETIQKQIMQFKTNYRSLKDAKNKANILKKLIAHIDNEIK